MDTAIFHAINEVKLVNDDVPIWLIFHDLQRCVI